MGVHRGEKLPCSMCGKVLANRRMHARHTASCVQGKKVECLDCGKQYVSTQGLKQHQKTKHGADAPDEGTYVCPYYGKQYHIKKSWAEHKPYCETNPNWKGSYFCRVTGCPTADHPFNQIQNLNFHMSNIHGWKEWHAWIRLAAGTPANECPLVVNEWPYWRPSVVTWQDKCLQKVDQVVRWVSIWYGMMGSSKTSVSLWTDGRSTELPIDQSLYSTFKAPGKTSVSMGFTIDETSDLPGVFYLLHRYCDLWYHDLWLNCIFTNQCLCGCLVILVLVHHIGDLYILPRFATLGQLLLGTVFILRVSPGGWTGIHKENIKFPIIYKILTIVLFILLVHVVPECMHLIVFYFSLMTWGVIEIFFSAAVVFQGRLIEFFPSAWWSFPFEIDSVLCFSACCGRFFSAW